MRFLREAGVTDLGAVKEQTMKVIDAHNREETPLFAENIEKKARARASGGSRRPRDAACRWPNQLPSGAPAASRSCAIASESLCPRPCLGGAPDRALSTCRGLHLQRDADERGERREELAAEGGERVLRGRWARRQRRAGDDASLSELAEAGAQDARGDGRDVLPELAEARSFMIRRAVQGTAGLGRVKEQRLAAPRSFAGLDTSYRSRESSCGAAPGGPEASGSAWATVRRMR